MLVKALSPYEIIVLGISCNRTIFWMNESTNIWLVKSARRAIKYPYLDKSFYIWWGIGNNCNKPPWCEFRPFARWHIEQFLRNLLTYALISSQKNCNAKEHKFWVVLCDPSWEEWNSYNNWCLIDWSGRITSLPCHHNKFFFQV